MISLLSAINDIKTPKGAHQEKKSFLSLSLGRKNKGAVGGTGTGGTGIGGASSGGEVAAEKSLILNKLESLSTREKSLIMALLVVVLTAILIVLVAIPTFEAVDASSEELLVAMEKEQAAISTISRAEGDIAAYAEAKLNFDGEKKLFRRKTGIPDVPEQGQMLPEQLDRLVSTMVQDSGLKPINLSFQSVESESPFVYSAPILWGLNAGINEKQAAPDSASSSSDTSNAAASGGYNGGDSANTSTSTSAGADSSANSDSGTASTSGDTATGGAASESSSSSGGNVDTGAGAGADSTGAVANNPILTYNITIEASGGFNEALAFIDTIADRFYVEIQSISVDGNDSENASEEYSYSVTLKLYLIDLSS